MKFQVFFLFFIFHSSLYAAKPFSDDVAECQIIEVINETRQLGIWV